MIKHSYISPLPLYNGTVHAITQSTGTIDNIKHTLNNLTSHVTVLEWLVRLFNVCFMLSIVPVDWVIACMVPLYKGKGDTYECSNFRGISLLSVVGKVYGRVLINRIRD